MNDQTIMMIIILIQFGLLLGETVGLMLVAIGLTIMLWPKRIQRAVE